MEIMWLWPTKKQWNSWSIPSKWTVVGAYVGIIALLVGLLSLVPSRAESSGKKPELELKLLLRIGGFQIHVANAGSAPANEVTVSLESWQIGAPGPDVETEFPIRNLAPNDDFTFQIEPRRLIGEAEYDRERVAQPTCGYAVVRSINCPRPRAWAFFIPGQGQTLKHFQKRDPWPMVEFDYPRNVPRGYECVDYPPGVCGDLQDTNFIWRLLE